MCNAEFKTVPLSTNPINESLSIVVTNAASPCGGPVLNTTATVAQTDAFGDATAIVLNGPLGSGPLAIPPFASHPTALSVTLPAGAPKGTRCFTITLSGPNFTTVTCLAKLEVGPVIEVRERTGHSCTLAGAVVSKTFRIFNRTTVARTVDWTVRSTQFTSTNGAGDHYPIALCGGVLAPDPANPVPPSLSNTIIVPAGVGAFVDVCIDTQSFPQCQEGSACHLEIVATDQATGCAAIAQSDVTVIAAGWDKNFPPPPLPVPALPPWAVAGLVLLVIAMAFLLLRSKTTSQAVAR